MEANQNNYRRSITEKLNEQIATRSPSHLPEKALLKSELIKASKGSIEYVIIHELCHLVNRNHDRAFFDLQNKMMPGWKKWKDRLECTLA